MSAFIEDHRERFGIEAICRTLQVAPSTYYAPPRAPALTAGAARPVAEVHAARTGYRGSTAQTWRDLRRRGVEVGRDRVARLMRAAGLESVRRGRKVRTTTPAETAVDRARDLVERRFAADSPNQLWLADITPTSGPGSASATCP